MSVLLIGYYGFDNIGDEVLLEKSIHTIQKIFPLSKIKILINTKNSFRVNKLRSLYPNLLNKNSIVNRWSFFSVFSAIFSSSIIVFGGGGLFQDQTSKKSFIYYLSILAMSAFLNKKIYFLAQGLGPITSKYLRKFFSYFLKSVVAVSVRDKESLKELTSLGYSKDKIFLSADLAFYKAKISQFNTSKHQYFGLSFRDINVSKDIKNQLTQFLSKLPANQIFLDLNPEKDQESYTNFIKKEISQVIKFNPSQFINLSIDKNLTFIIGMRYHSLVFAALLGIPFFALAYDPKIISLAKTLGQPYYKLYGNCQNDKNLENTYQNFQNNFDLYKTNIIINCKKLITKAKINEKIFL